MNKNCIATLQSLASVLIKQLLLSSLWSDSRSESVKTILLSAPSQLTLIDAHYHDVIVELHNVHAYNNFILNSLS